MSLYSEIIAAQEELIANVGDHAEIKLYLAFDAINEFMIGVLENNQAIVVNDDWSKVFCNGMQMFGDTALTEKKFELRLTGETK